MKYILDLLNEIKLKDNKEDYDIIYYDKTEDSKKEINFKNIKVIISTVEKLEDSLILLKYLN